MKKTIFTVTITILFLLVFGLFFINIPEANTNIFKKIVGSQVLTMVIISIKYFLLKMPNKNTPDLQKDTYSLFLSIFLVLFCGYYLKETHLLNWLLLIGFVDIIWPRASSK